MLAKLALLILLVLKLILIYVPQAAAVAQNLIGGS